MSVPADPTAPSFLTISPEIRNVIYDVLFYKPKGIRIAPSSAYTPDNIFEDKVLLGYLSKCLPILSTCRQIYHEAASTFLSNNTWIISRYTGRDPVGKVDDGTVKQCNGAARWLYGLGTSAIMVKKIVIDFDKTCRRWCSEHGAHLSGLLNELNGVEGAIRMQFFLLEIWQRPYLEVEFVHPKTQAHYDFHPMGKFDSGLWETGVQTQVLTTALKTILRDPLRIIA
ncbi:hypothetical protein CC86DRAFT_28531 [Ophiobolus disseminans]|uniref:Uncharacterized protein n=1 Tax=Ophiobolus disseminans TaxID=1469910 RepID=A0A6A6ZZ80_9PLEO|nr:hypothetical protein CC86DRAFT_28531 [Ophiobolus disseminans]